MKKLFLALLAVFSIALVVAGCGGACTACRNFESDQTAAG